jgi:hypothetical protein
MPVPFFIQSIPVWKNCALKTKLYATGCLAAICVSCILLPVDSQILLSLILGGIFFSGLVILLRDSIHTAAALEDVTQSSIALGVAGLASILCVDIYPTLLGVFITGACGLAMLFWLVATLLFAGLRFKRYGWYCIVPFIICAVFLLSGRCQWLIPRLAEEINRWQFQREIDDYNHIVDQVKDGTIPTDEIPRRIDSLSGRELPWGVKSVRAVRWGPDSFAVEFMRSSANVRVKRGFLFLEGNESDEKVNAILGGGVFNEVQNVSTNWYSFEQ